MASPPATDRLLSTLREVASQLAADELAIKRAILDAATKGNCDRVLSIVREWLTSSSGDVRVKVCGLG